MDSSDYSQLPLPPDSLTPSIPQTPQKSSPPGPIEKINKLNINNLGSEKPVSQALTVYKPPIEPSSPSAKVFQRVYRPSDSSENPAAHSIGGAEDIKRQDDEAERNYLATYRALHFGGKETAESRLIRSAMLPVQKTITFSPSSLHLELSLFEEIQDVLSKNFDLNQTPISSIELVSDPDRRNRILRIGLKNTQQRVIFKESLPLKRAGQTPNVQDIEMSYDRFARDWAGLEFASSLQKNYPLCPKCYSGSEDYHFMLQEDLGRDHVSLASHLLGHEGSKAEGSLLRYMTTMGRFHGAAHSEVDRYLNILKKINPESQEISIERTSENAFKQLKSVLVTLQLTCPEGLEEEITKVIASVYDPKGPFVTLTHGDPCPDNVFDFPDNLLLIDFEVATVGSALLDATYPRLNMPSGWCAGQFPDNLIATAESTYREEIKQSIPAAMNDKLYSDAYSQAIAVHILNHTMHFIPDVYENDETWGIASVRSRVLTHLDTFIQTSEKHETAPILCSLSKDALAILQKKWISKPLDFYPAFQETKKG